MARLWSAGAEFNSLSAGFEFGVSFGTPVISSAVKRSGSYSLSIPSLTTLTAKGVRYQFASPSSNGALFFRVYFRVDTLPLLETAIINLNDADDNATPVVYITLDATGALALFDEDGQIGSDSSALSTATWYRIEIEYDRTGAAGAHIVRARIDGTEFAGAANRDLSVGIQFWAVGGNLDGSANATGVWYFDDWAINNSSGSFQNSYPGEGEIIILRPNGAGDNTTWTRGGTDTGANWDQVNDITHDDAGTYVESNTSGEIDDYNIEDTPAALESTDTINCVQVGVRSAVSDTTGGDPDVTLRIKASSGGTLEESASLNVSVLAYRTNNNAINTYALTLYDLPGASTTAWTKADLDQAQIGIRESETDTHFARVSNLWLLVDHKPGAAAQATRKFQRASVLGN